MDYTEKSAAREKLYSLLGDLPDRSRPVGGKTIAVMETAYMRSEVIKFLKENL